MIHIGFTGTRQGMTQNQSRRVAELADDIAGGRPVIAHHGCCVGSDADFHAICHERRWHVVGHPATGWPHAPYCARVICDEVADPLPFLSRNADIVDAVCDEDVYGVMFAAPYESTMQRRGGTWSTIRMALRARRSGEAPRPVRDRPPWRSARSFEVVCMSRRGVIAATLSRGQMFAAIECARLNLEVACRSTDLMSERDRKLLSRVRETLGGIEQRLWAEEEERRKAP